MHPCSSKYYKTVRGQCQKSKKISLKAKKFYQRTADQHLRLLEKKKCSHVHFYFDLSIDLFHGLVSGHGWCSLVGSDESKPNLHKF